MSKYSDLTDLELNLETGEPVIDPNTNDGVLISGTAVILQDTAIRLRTQLGQIKRQGLDDFGWDYMARLKKDIDLNTLMDTAREIERMVLLDTRVDDARAVPFDKTDEETVLYKITLEIEDAIAGEVTVTL